MNQDLLNNQISELRIYVISSTIPMNNEWDQVYNASGECICLAPGVSASGTSKPSQVDCQAAGIYSWETGLILICGHLELILKIKLEQKNCHLCHVFIHAAWLILIKSGGGDWGLPRHALFWLFICQCSLHHAMFKISLSQFQCRSSVVKWRIANAN